jgi:hypothetical protein
MSRFEEIGMSQRVRLEWFEQTAQLALAGLGRTEIETELKALLQDKLSVGGSAVRGNREKVITILVRTWVDIDADLEPLRVDGLQLIRELPVSDHLAVHWGMVMAAYPFWGVVAETVGRLLRLQGTVGASEVQRRVRELRGERETVARAARRVLRAFHDWGVLEGLSRKGTSHKPAPLPVDDPRLVPFLAEAWLRGSGVRSGALVAFKNSPALFPFHLMTHAGKVLKRDGRVELVRHAGDEEVLALREATGPP